MNRAERRRHEKQKKGKVSFEDSQRLGKAAMSQGISYATDSLYVVLSAVLHDKWGWGHQRIARLLEQIEYQYSCVSSGHVKIDELRGMVEEELKIRIIKKD